MMLTFILVEPKRAANVGAAARAMHTMGFGALRIVGEPLHLSTEAQALAHGSGQVLETAQHFDSLSGALEGLELVIGTSAKSRHQRRYHYNPQQLCEMLLAKRLSTSRVGLLFGREECGLSNEAIAQCDLLTQVPLAAPQPSLNLAQAVMIYSYCLSGLDLCDKTHSAEPGQYQALKSKLGDLLHSAGIGEEEKTWRWAMERLAAATDDDVGFLHFICDKLLRDRES